MDTTFLFGLYTCIAGTLLCISGIVVRLFDKQARRERAEQLLCFAVAIMVWHIFIYAMIVSGKIVHMPHFYNKGIPFYYLVAPCAYFYTLLKLYPGTKISRYWYLHLLPAVGGLIDILPYAFAGLEEKNALLQHVVTDMQMGFKHSYGYIDQKWHYVIKFVLAFIYVMAQWRLIYLFEANESRVPAERVRLVVHFSIAYSLHYVLQGSMVLNVLFNQLQGSFILRDISQIVWVSLFFMLFSLWFFSSGVYRPFIANRRIRKLADTQIRK